MAAVEWAQAERAAGDVVGAELGHCERSAREDGGVGVVGDRAAVDVYERSEDRTTLISDID